MLMRKSRLRGTANDEEISVGMNLALMACSLRDSVLAIEGKEPVEAIDSCLRVFAYLRESGVLMGQAQETLDMIDTFIEGSHESRRKTAP
jgi:hypothetical protein